MSDVRRETVTVFASQAIALLSGLAVQSALARFLGADQRGAYAICLTLSTVLGVVFVPGTDRAAQYFHVTKRMSLSESTSVALLFALLATVVGAAAGALGVFLQLSVFAKASPDQVMLGLATCLPATLAAVVLELQLASLREYGRIALIAAIQAMTNLASTLLLTGGLKLGVAGALLAQAAALCAAIGVYWYTLRTRHGLRFVMPRREAIRSVFGYGGRYYAARVGHQVDYGLAVLVLGAIASRTDVGLYAAVSSLVLRVLIVPTTIEIVLMPRLAAAGADRFESVERACRMATLATVAACIPVVLLSKWILEIFLSAEFVSGSIVVWWLAPGVAMLGAAGCLMTHFRMNNQPQICSAAIWAGLLVNLVGAVLLYPVFGLSGAAIAGGASLAVRALVLLYCYRRGTGRSVSRVIFPRLSDISSALSVMKGARATGTA